MFPAETYVSCPPPACSTLLSLVRPCRILPASSAAWTLHHCEDRFAEPCLSFPVLRPLVPVGNSHSDILVVQPAQDGHGQRLTDGLDGAGDRRVLLQR